jgi:putative DNA primase/helicase
MAKHISAETIAKALGGRRTGQGWSACCPAHDDHNPSLSITEKDGRVLVHCFAGCEQDAIIAALKARGLWDDTRCTTPVVERFTRDQVTLERIAAAKEIWASCQDGERLTAYLNARSITLAVPPSLRFHPALLHTPTGLHLPAMVAAIQNSSRAVTAIQRTYLTSDCSSKAGVHPPKMALGPLEDGAIRLARAGEVLGLAEGIETALSAMQLRDIPVWISCGCMRLNSVALPEQVREVHVFSDNGEIARTEAEKAADRFTREGRRVLLRFPPDRFGDWNDVINGRIAA